MFSSWKCSSAGVKGRYGEESAEMADHISVGRTIFNYSDTRYSLRCRFWGHWSKARHEYRSCISVFKNTFLWVCFLVNHRTLTAKAGMKIYQFEVYSGWFFLHISLLSGEIYTDSTGTDLTQFIINTLNKNSKDRVLMLKLEQEMSNLVGFSLFVDKSSKNVFRWRMARRPTTSSLTCPLTTGCWCTGTVKFVAFKKTMIHDCFQGCSLFWPWPQCWPVGQLRHCQQNQEHQASWPKIPRAHYGEYMRKPHWGVKGEIVRLRGH